MNRIMPSPQRGGGSDLTGGGFLRPSTNSPTKAAQSLFDPDIPFPAFRPVSTRSHAPGTPQANATEYFASSTPKRRNSLVADSKSQLVDERPSFNFRSTSRDILGPSLFKWNVATLIAYAYNMIVVPHGLAFLENSEFARYLDQQMEAVFLFDPFVRVVVLLSSARSHAHLSSFYILRSAVLFHARDKHVAVFMLIVMCYFAGVFPWRTVLQWASPPTMATSTSGHMLVRVLRLFRFHGLWSFVQALRPPASGKRQHQIRVVKMFVSMLFVTHWTACLWAALGRLQHGWRSSAALDGLVEASAVYVESLFWSVSNTGAVGFSGYVLFTTQEVFLSSIAMMGGCLLWAMFFGQVAGLMQNLDTPALSHRQKTEAVERFLCMRRVPQQLLKRVTKFYSAHWQRYRGLDEFLIVQALPACRQQEVADFLHKELVQNVRIFQAGDVQFVQLVTQNLRPAICLAEDTILRQGELGDTVYFLAEGQMEVERDGIPLAVLVAGSYFGDVSLLLTECRSATVRALSVCDMAWIPGAVLLEILEEFSVDYENMQMVAQERLAQTDFHDDDLLVADILIDDASADIVNRLATPLSASRASVGRLQQASTPKKLAAAHSNSWRPNPTANVTRFGSIILPSSWIRQLMDVLLALAIVYNITVIPFTISFQTAPQGLWRPVLCFFDAVYILELLLTFRTAVVVDGVMVVDAKVIVSRYVSSYFLLDLFSCAHSFRFLSDPPLVIVGDARLPHLLRAYRLPEIVQGWKKRSTLSSAFTDTAEVIVVFLLSFHLIACMFNVMGWLSHELNSLGGSWLTEEHLDDASVTHRYINSLYWSVSTVGAVVYGDVQPQSVAEKLFTVAIVFLGCKLLLAYVFAQMAMTVAEVNGPSMRYRNTMADMHRYMRLHKLPTSLQTRIMNYFECLWYRQHGLDELTILADLPESLRTDLLLHQYRDLVEKVPVFQNQAPGLVNSIVKVLRPQLVMAREMVCRAGEVATEMYFVFEGRVEVCSRDGRTVICEMVQGDYFGEIALITQARRNASVRTAEVSTLCVLNKSDISRVMSAFPDFSQAMHALAGLRSNMARPNQASPTAHASPVAGSAPDSSPVLPNLRTAARRRHLMGQQSPELTSPDAPSSAPPVAGGRSGVRRRPVVGQSPEPSSPSKGDAPLPAPLSGGLKKFRPIEPESTLDDVVAASPARTQRFSSSSAPFDENSPGRDRDQRLLSTDGGPEKRANERSPGGRMRLQQTSSIEGRSPGGHSVKRTSSIDEILPGDGAALRESSDHSSECEQRGLSAELLAKRLTSEADDMSSGNAVVDQRQPERDGALRHTEQRQPGSAGAHFHIEQRLPGSEGATFTEQQVEGDGAISFAEQRQSGASLLTEQRQSGRDRASLMTEKWPERDGTSVLTEPRQAGRDEPSSSVPERDLPPLQGARLSRRAAEPALAGSDRDSSPPTTRAARLSSGRSARLESFDASPRSRISSGRSQGRADGPRSPRMSSEQSAGFSEQSLGDMKDMQDAGTTDDESWAGASSLEACPAVAPSTRRAPTTSVDVCPPYAPSSTHELRRFVPTPADASAPFVPNLAGVSSTVAPLLAPLEAPSSYPAITSSMPRGSDEGVGGSDADVATAGVLQFTPPLQPSASPTPAADAVASELELSKRETRLKKTLSTTFGSARSSALALAVHLGVVTEEHPSKFEDAVVTISSDEETSILFTALNPLSPFHRAWEVLLCVVALYSIIFEPLSLSFGIPLTGPFFVCECILVVVYSASIILRFRTGVFIHGTIHMSLRSIAASYLRSGLVSDVLSTFPFGLLLQTPDLLFSPYQLLRCFRLLRTSVVRAVFARAEANSRLSMTAVRLSMVFFATVMLTHWVGCAFFFVSVLECGSNNGDMRDSWVGAAGVGESLGERYLMSTYWAVKTFSHTGFNDVVPVTLVEKAFVCGVIVLGTLLYSLLFGNICDIIVHVGDGMVAFDNESIAMLTYARSHNISSKVADKLRQYLDYIRAHQQGLDESALLQQLPSTLKAEAQVGRFHRLFNACPLFQAKDLPLVHSITRMLTCVVYLPHDHIIQEGTQGTTMYFVNDGEVLVRAIDGEHVVGALTVGDFFGEIALLHACTRTASVSAATVVEVASLDAPNLALLLVLYPSFSSALRARAAERLKRYSHETDTSELPLLWDAHADASDLLLDTRCIVHPHSTFKTVWVVLVALVSVLACVYVPLVVSFGWVLSPWTLAGDFIVTAVFMLDVVVKCRTAIRDANGLLVFSPRAIFFEYLKGGFAKDVLCAFPFVVFLFRSTSDRSSLLLLIKCLKISEFSAMMVHLRRSTHMGPLSSLLQPVCFFLLFIHFLTCVTMYISRVASSNPYFGEEASLSSWLGTSRLLQAGQDHADYFYALFLVASSLTSTGVSAYPVRMSERLWLMFLMVTGDTLFAALFGRMAALAREFHSDSARLEERARVVQEFLDFRGIDSGLKSRIHSIFDALSAHLRSEGEDANVVFGHLPLSLRLDISTQAYAPVLGSVPLLRGCSVEFVRSLCEHFKAESYAPSDYCARQSHLSRAIFIVSTGTVEALLEPSLTVLGKLERGDFFGEETLVSGSPLSFSVRAVTFCQFLLLESVGMRLLCSHSTIGPMLTKYVALRKKICLTGSLRGSRCASGSRQGAEESDDVGIRNRRHTLLENPGGTTLRLQPLEVQLAPQLARVRRSTYNDGLTNNADTAVHLGSSLVEASYQRTSFLHTGRRVGSTEAAGGRRVSQTDSPGGRRVSQTDSPGGRRVSRTESPGGPLTNKRASLVANLVMPEDEAVHHEVEALQPFTNLSSQSAAAARNRSFERGFTVSDSQWRLGANRRDDGTFVRTRSISDSDERMRTHPR